MGRSPHPLIGAVVDGLMPGEVPADSGIVRRLIGHQAALTIDVLSHDLLDRWPRDGFDADGADVAAALDERERTFILWLGPRDFRMPRTRPM